MCEIGKKMYLRRKELGLTLEEVGDAVGVGKSTVRKWENGLIRNRGRDKLAALAKVLQMDPVEFVPGDGQKNDHTPAYTGPDDMERLEALHQDPRLGLLFDHTRKMKKEDVDFMIQMAERIMKERDG